MEKNDFVDLMRQRTKDFGLRIIKLYPHLPKRDEAKMIGRQLLRSATSVAANYRAVCRARSKAEFFAKLSVTVEEADESLLWLDYLVEAELMPANRLDNLREEARELIAILSKARKNTN